MPSNNRSRADRSKRAARARESHKRQGLRDAREGGEAGEAPKAQETRKAPARLLPHADRLLIPHGWKIGLLVAALYVAVMGVLSFKYHVIGDYGVETDFYMFVFQAKKLLYGGFQTDGARGPVYFIVLALFGGIIGNYFYAGLTIGLLSAGLVIYFTYVLLRRLCGEEIAFLATVITACNPVFVQFTYSSGTDMIFAALATMTMYSFLAPDRLRYLGAALTGILCALSYLTRYNGVFMVVGIAMTLLFLDIWRVGRRRRVICCAVFLSVFVAVTIPWGMFLQHQTGDFFYNPNYKNVAFLVYGQGSIDWDEFIRHQGEEFHSFADVVRRNPGLFASKMIRSVYRHVVGDMRDLMGWYVGLLAVPGLGLILLDRTRKRRFAYVVLNLLAFGTLVTVAYNPRFSLVLIPFYAFLSLKTLAFIRERGARSLRIAGGLVPAVVLIVVALTFVDSVRFNRGQIDKGPRHVLKTAEWFRTRVPERYRKGIIVARKPHIAYYLDLDFRWIPDVKTYDDLIASLKAMRAEYLYFSLIEAHWRPELASLLNPNLDHPGLVPLMYVGKPPVSVLYKVSY